jgi:hypothetical protein
MTSKNKSYLAACPASSKLASLPKSSIQVNPDIAIVQPCAVDKSLAVQGGLVGGVFDKGKTTWSLFYAVQSHYDPPDSAAFGAEIVNLLLGGEEREIADIHSGGFANQSFVFLLSPLNSKDAKIRRISDPYTAMDRLCLQ